MKMKLAAKKPRQYRSTLFFVAGFFMSVNVIVLWARFYSDVQLSILWAAVPAIIALATSAVGLFKLYPLISTETPYTAKAGAGFASIAIVSLTTATLWILGLSLFGPGIDDVLPSALLALIGIFIVAMVLAFACNACAFLQKKLSQRIGLLLALPVISWGVMLFVTVLKDIETGLSLDLYTNAIIAMSLLLIGSSLRKKEKI